MLRPLILKRLVLLAALSSLGMINTGCEDQSQATLASAQSCLDAANTTAKANACAAKVANDHSAEAYLIRCSANFIAQGVTGDRLANAYKQMSTSSSNKTTALMAYLIFDDSLTGNTASETTFNCQSSGVASIFQLASAAALATAVGKATSTALGVSITSLLPDANGNVNTGTLQTAMATLETNITSWGPNDPRTIQAESTIGSAVSNSYGAFCSTSSSFSSEDVCTKINSAVASGSTSQDVGATLLGLLQSGH